MAKKETGYINLIIGAGMANPAPPIGPALGQHGVNIKAFTDDFNAKTSDMERGMPIPVVITVYEDRSFDFIMKKPPNSYFIKKAAKLKSGANNPGHETVATIRSSQVKEIAEAKMADLNAVNIEGAMRIIEGSARSMGVEVVEG
ncbi:MAG: 50S ribosomal protein L11 [Alphaproteobacteria bacterium]|nr:50S ribosomal protein L11 [Alphaproteobacteria bacterium]